MIDHPEFPCLEHSTRPHTASSSAETTESEVAAILESVGDLLREVLLRVEDEVLALQETERSSAAKPGLVEMPALATPSPEALFGSGQVVSLPPSVLRDPEEFLKAIDFMTKRGERDASPAREETEEASESEPQSGSDRDQPRA